MNSTQGNPSPRHVSLSTLTSTKMHTIKFKAANTEQRHTLKPYDYKLLPTQEHKPVPLVLISYHTFKVRNVGCFKQNTDLKESPIMD
jgi:hypothetical protein